MKKILSIIGLISVGFICLTGCSKEDDSSKYNINVNSDENIEVKTYVDYEKDYLIIDLTNNNTYNIGSFDVEAIFYDNNGNKMGDDFDSGLDFISGGNYIVMIDLPEDEEYNNIIPDKIDLTVKIDHEYQSIIGEEPLYNDKVATSYNRVGDEIEVSITNNSGVELSSVELMILFMKNGKPIYADGLDGSLISGETDTATIDIPEDWEKSMKSDEDVLIDYDSIKIIVNRASAD